MRKIKKILKALCPYTHTHGRFLHEFFKERRSIFTNYFSFSFWSEGGTRNSIETSLVSRDLI